MKKTSNESQKLQFKNIFRLFFLSLIITGTISVFSSCSGGTTNETSNVPAKVDSTEVTEVYSCPMNCEGGKTYDKPGQCPVCGMDLEKKN